VNYFKFCAASGKAECYFVDLPGYGYARASKTDRASWLKTTKSFLENRPFTIMKRVFLLVDSRHAIKDSDLEMMDLLNSSKLSYQVVLTKSDASTRQEQSVCLSSTFKEMMAKHHPCGFPMVHLVSAVSGQGLDALKQSITEIAYTGLHVENLDNFNVTS